MSVAHAVGHRPAQGPQPRAPGQACSASLGLEAEADRAELGRRVGRPGVVHAANSAALLAFPEARYDLVRVGIALYGVPPAPTLDGAVALRPALSLRSRVTHVKSETSCSHSRPMGATNIRRPHQDLGGNTAEQCCVVAATGMPVQPSPAAR